MTTICITGANRGIGLEFARQYADAGADVIGTARDPDNAHALKATGAEIMHLDVASASSRDAFVSQIGDKAIDIFINNSGVGGMGGPAPDIWLETLHINSIAPTLLALALQDNVARSTDKKMIAITSNLGSIANNDSGGMISYRSSKAALNAAWRSLSIDMRGNGVTLAMLHPGWVRTDMGGENATISPETSVKGMRQVIDKLEPEQSGAFLDYKGQTLPW